MSEIGHNLPPDMTQTAGETAKALSDWMAENPVIETEDQAREAKVYIDRGKLCVQDLEAERDGKVRPLNEEVKRINESYRSPRELLGNIIRNLSERMEGYIQREEKVRKEIAEEALRKAEAERSAALDAEQREREAFESANAGELGVDILSATREADKRFKAYQKAERQAIIAGRDAKVRVSGGFTRSLSLKSREILVVTDLLAAVAALQDSGRIMDAIISAARSYKKVYGKYPPGISTSVERKV